MRRSRPDPTVAILDRGDTPRTGPPPPTAQAAAAQAPGVPAPLPAPGTLVGQALSSAGLGAGAPGAPYTGAVPTHGGTPPNGHGANGHPFATSHPAGNGQPAPTGHPSANGHPGSPQPARRGLPGQLAPGQGATGAAAVPRFAPPASPAAASPPPPPPPPPRPPAPPVAQPTRGPAAPTPVRGDGLYAFASAATFNGAVPEAGSPLPAAPGPRPPEPAAALPAPAGPIPGRPPLTPWTGAAQSPPPLSLHQPPPPVPPEPFGGARAAATAAMPRTGLAGFDDNPYLLAHRSAVGAPLARRRRPRLRVSFRMVAVVAVLAAGYVVYRVLHPSAHRSPTAVAIAFYTNLEHGSFSAAASDAEPAQLPAATAGVVTPQVQQFVHQALGHQLVEEGTTTLDGSETIVVLRACRANLSCSPTLAVPTVQVAGAWYVDWSTWLQAVPPASG